MKYNNTWLHAQLEANEKIKHLFFWGHQPMKDNRVNKSCCSQWYESPFEQDGIRYPTAEHWMMAGKARLFKDESTLAKILNCRTPAEAKKLGRIVQNFDRKIWEAHRSEIVVQGNVLKFGQDDDLWNFLDNTKERVLVEASPMDRIWGIGLAADAPGIEYPENWRGLNLLGYALMEARDRLRKQNK